LETLKKSGEFKKKEIGYEELREEHEKLKKGYEVLKAIKRKFEE